MLSAAEDRLVGQGHVAYAVRVHLRVRPLVRDLDGPQANQQRYDIVQHVKRVGNECEGMDGIS